MGTHPEGHSFEVFSKSYLFHGLASQNIEYFYSLSREVSLEAGDYLIREGEVGRDLYILIEGELSITKQEPQTHELLLVGKVLPGETVGEIALLDRGARAASVTAVCKSKVRCLLFEELQRSVKQNPEYASVFFHIAENTAQRLRHTNDIALSELRGKLSEFQMRTNLGLFFIAIVTITTLFIYSFSWLRYFLRVVPNTSLVSIPLTLAMGSSFYFLVKRFKLPWNELGITTKNLWRGLKEGFLFALVGVLIGAGLKLLMLHFHWYLQKRPFFDPFAMIANKQDQNWGYWSVVSSVYVLFFVPIQELFTRGGLQGILERFLTNKHRVGVSIFVSNLIFSSIHVMFSVYLGLIVLFAGIGFGWLYSRTHNLYGCILAHAILGVVGFNVLGMVGFLFKLH